MVPSTPEEYGLFDYWSIVRKRWSWVLLPVVLFTTLATLYSLNESDRYEAMASVLLADTASQQTLDPSSQNTSFLSRELSNEISLAESDTVEQLVEDQLGGLPDVSISSDSDADVLVFSASAGEPKDAALYANTWADMYIKVKRDEVIRDITAATASLQDRLAELREARQSLRAPLDDLSERIEASPDPELAARLQREYERLSDDLRYELELVTGQAEAAVASLTQLELQAELSAVGEARIVQVAAPPSSRSNTPLSRNVALGLTVGLLAGFGLALLAETRDKTIKTAGDVASVTDLPVLASIPEATKKQQLELPFAAHRDPEGMYADGYHKVRSSLEFVSFEKEMKTVLITSANAAEGKSTTSSNLALALSSVGQKTVLLDVDFRRARVHEIYNIAQAPGYSDVVLYGAEMTSVAYAIQEPGLNDLLVVPTGTTPPSPAAFVGTGGFLKTLDWVKSQADVVVMDAPPLLAVSDAHTLAKHVDAVVLTARAGQTTKDELIEVINVLGQVGANVIGVVLIGVSETEAYGKHYYYRSAERTPAPRATKSKEALWSGPPKSTTTIDLDLTEVEQATTVLN